MKKRLLIILITILFIPFIVNAKDECDNKSIIFKSIEKESIIGDVIENSESTITNSKVNLDVTLHDIGDTIEYKLLVKNNSNDNYYINEDSLINNTDYIEYTFYSKDNKNYISPNEEKYIYLKVNYKNEVPTEKLENDLYNETNSITLNLSNRKTIIINPETNSSIILFIVFILLILTPYIIYRKKSFIALFLIAIIPLSVDALCKLEMEVNSKIQIDKKDTMFLPGPQINVIMKNLAGDDTTTDGKNTIDTSITGIVYSETEPTNDNKNIVSTEESRYPIYMWYDNGTIYWWSLEHHPKLNVDSSYMFRFFTGLSDIDSFQLFNLSKVKDLSFFLYGAQYITDISPVANWNVSNIENFCATFGGNDNYKMNISTLAPLKNWNISNSTNIAGMFQYNKVITSLDGIENFDTSKVTNMASLFHSCYFVDDISQLTNWDTSKVTNMNGVFYYNQSIIDYSPISNWDVSQVDDMSYMFGMGPWATKIGDPIIDFSPLQNWDTSSVVNLKGAFQNINILSYEAFSNWDVSNVTNFAHCFNSTSKSTITTLHGLENWDVSSGQSMVSMFADHRALTDPSAINDWDVRNVLSFSSMFSSSTVFPEWTKVTGTWDKGTFTRTG